MRTCVLILSLTLPACSKDNAGFGVELTRGASDSAGASSGGDDGDATSEPTTTDDPGPTQAATSDSTVAPTTDEPTTDATSDASDTSDSADGSSTGAPACQPPAKNDALDVRVRKNQRPIDQCDPREPSFFKGVLHLDGHTLRLESTFECVDKAVGDQVVLGSGFMVDAFDGPSPCVKAMVEWDPASPDCKLGLLDIRLTADPEQIVYLGAFTLAPGADFPLHVTSENLTFCGCDDGGVGCCTAPDAGALQLVPDGGGPVPQFGKGPASSGEQDYVFFNQQSWMGPECDDGGGRHIDWLARAVM